MRLSLALLRRWLAPDEPTPAAATPALSHCELGLHRDTVETNGGYMLRRRCLDCAHTQPIGWVWTGKSNHRTHHPWEVDDA